MTIRTAAVLCVVALLLSADAATARTLRARQQSAAGEDAGALALGRAARGELKGGAQHSYSIKLDAGQFLRVVVAQQGVDVVVSLYAPDGRRVSEVDSPTGTEGEEEIVWVAEAGGAHRLEVRTHESSALAGRYEAKLVELRAGAARDKNLVAAVAALAESERLRVQNTPEALSSARAKLAEAVATFKAAGDAEREADALRRHVFVVVAQNLPAEALPSAQRALELSEAAHGPHHVKVAASLGTLADVSARLGRLPEARAMNERALSIYEKGGAADSLGAAAVLSAHANVLAAQGAGDAAVSAGRRALQIFEKQYGPESVPAAGAAFALANILHNSKSQFAESQALYERALRVYESKFGAESTAVAATLNALALPLLAKGDAAGALASNERALRIAEKVYGPESPAAAQAAQAVGYVFFQTRELAKARAAYERALSLYEKAFGAESPAALGALNAVGGVLVAEGQHAAAREKFDRAIRIGEKLYGPESQPVAFNLLSKAATYQGAEHYAVVSDFYDRAVKIYEKVYGAESVPVADVLAAAGDYDRSHDKEQTARARYERAVKIYEQAQGREAAAVGFLLLKIGKSLGEENKSAEAFEPLSRAMSIYEKYYGENHLALADPLTELAAAYAFRNDLTKAAGLLQRSLKILEDHKLGDELVVTDTLDPLAFLLLAEGKLDAGQEVATRSLKVYESHPRHTFYADEIDLRNALGSILLMKGDFVAARAFMEATVARAEKTLGPQSPEMLRAVYNMTYLLAAQGDFETVTRHIARTRAHSQALVESGDPMAVQILQLTAALSAHQGREDEARELIKKSAESAEKIFGPDNFITAQVLTGLASMLASVNDHAGAESINARALRIFEQTGTGTGLAALARSNKGDLLLRQGKLSEARAAYEEAAQTLERQRNSKHIMTAGVLNSLGRVNLLQNDIPKAQAAFLKAADLTGHHIQSVLPSLSLAEQRVFLELEMPEQISSLLTSCRDGAAVGNAYELMFRWKGSLIDSLRRQTVVTRLGLSGPHGKQVARLRAVRADIAGLYYKARTMPAEEWQRKNDELTREKEELERELARLLKPGELADPLAAGFREFQRLLRPDEVFLDVYLYDFRRRDNTVESRYAVVIVGPSGSPSLADLGPAKRINEAVKAWRTEVLARVDADAEWAALSALLWKPLAESLPAGARRVWVSPDGELARLPWQLLAGTHAKTKDFMLTQADSARELARLRQPRPAAPAAAPATMLLAGNIDFDAGLASGARRAEGRGFPPLDGTRTEVESIRAIGRSLRADVTLLTGAGASKASVVGGLQRATYAHLATHGFFAREAKAVTAALGEMLRSSPPDGATPPPNARNPLVESGVALAGANVRDPATLDARGMLTAEEIIGLDLGRCELVTLSACETGRGEEVTGQGVMGLRASVMAAGSRSMLMSLWKVPDAATVKFMEAFYVNLWTKKMTKAEALLRAQEAVRDHPSGEYRSPVNWAAWVLAGEAW